MDPCLPKSNVKREIVSDPPNRPAENGKCFFRIEFPLIDHFSYRADRPIVRPFNDGPHEQVGAMLSRESGANVEVNRSPGPSLRHNSKPARAHPMLVIDARQQNAE